MPLYCLKPPAWYSGKCHFTLSKIPRPHHGKRPFLILFSILCFPQSILDTAVRLPPHILYICCSLCTEWLFCYAFEWLSSLFSLSLGVTLFDRPPWLCCIKGCLSIFALCFFLPLPVPVVLCLQSTYFVDLFPVSSQYIADPTEAGTLYMFYVLLYTQCLSQRLVHCKH